MTKRSEQIIFIGNREADHVMIEPLSEVLGGWRSANIAVKSGVWAGHYTGQFLLGELTKFGKEIEAFCRNLKRMAALVCVEHYLQMTITSDNRGVIHVEGRACDRLGAKTTLEFEFEIDRTTLPEIGRLLVEADRLD
jgi:hypothetical protein